MPRKFKGERLSYEQFLDANPEPVKQTPVEKPEEVTTKGIRAKLTAKSLTSRSMEARKRLVSKKPLVSRQQSDFKRDESAFPSLAIPVENKTIGDWSNAKETTLEYMKQAPKKVEVKQEEEVIEREDIQPIESDDEHETDNLMDAMREDDEWDDI